MRRTLSFRTERQPAGEGAAAVTEGAGLPEIAVSLAGLFVVVWATADVISRLVELIRGLRAPGP